MVRLFGRCEMNWIVLTVFGSSFLRIPLKNYGYELEDGLILITDNERMARRFVTRYCAETNGNGVCFHKTQKVQYPENYQCGFLIMQKGLKEEKIVDFLFQRTFLPIFVVGGILPEYLKADRYIFRLKNEDVDEICGKKTASKIKGFYTYIVENVTEVCNILEKLEDSILLDEYEGNERIAFSIFAGIGIIYATYLRQNHSERQVMDFLEKYIEETKARLQYMTEFACGVEISKMLASLVWDYIEDNREILIADIDEIDGKIYAALKSESVILFDYQYYYFPPKLLIKICQPLLETVSEPELKRRLRDEKIIYCNSADYTVKKDIVNVYGGKERPRFLWVSKDAILSPDNLRLEDVFDCDREGEQND